MEPSAIRLLLKRWNNRSKEFMARQKVSSVYVAKLPTKVQIRPLEKSTPMLLRFPLLVKDREGLIAFLKSKGIYIGDTWYDAPVAPKRYLEKTNYTMGQCPNAEKIAKTIVNLPTHLHVNENKALEIANEVNKWLKSQ
jgi:dTDP-4-amino-4,6-dideoxygalactose transaminase